MRPAAPDPARPPRSLLDILLIASAAVTLVLYVLAARAGAWGDDLVLYADALRGAGLFEPISAHVRPVVRLHFLVAAHTVSPDALRWVSLVLHALAAAAAGWAFAPLYGGRIAARAALLFFALPVASEAVFWPAAAGQLYAVLFVLLGVRAWAAGRAALCGLLLLLAAGSYEVWVVALVLLPLWPARRRPENHAHHSV